jgi:hypothetical protein
MFFTGCKFDKKSSSVFDSRIQFIDSIKVLPMNEADVTIVTLSSPIEELRSSAIINDVKYVFLETTEESIIGMYDEISVYKDRIFILDDVISENIYIFDITGKFIGKMPKGAGVNEFVRVRGMFVDKKHDQLIVYDAGRKKFVFCTLDGKPLGKEVDVQLYFFGRYAITDSGEIVYITERFLPNPHVETLDKYRLLYTDSLGRITKVAFPFDDNKDLATSLSRFNNGTSDLLYYPKFTNDIYHVTDSVMTLKYRIDLSHYTPIGIDNIRSLRSYPELKEYYRKYTFMTYDLSETDEYLYFSVRDKMDRIYAFYNKKSNQTISFRNLIFDSNMVIDFPEIFSDGHYFLGRASPPKLKQMAESRRRDGHPLNKELEEKIANLKEDDNSPLVLFTLK